MTIALESEEMLQVFSDPDSWRKVNPYLHIFDRKYLESMAIPMSIDSESINGMRKVILREGYYHVSNLEWQMDLAGMAKAITNLSVKGFSPPFAFVYDEFWLLFAKLHSLIAGLLGDNYKMLPDFWIWHIDPTKNQGGWTPHRDKGGHSLFPDGSPKSLTVWIPLTKATPLNGCIYVVPAHRDPSYNSPEEHELTFALPDVRALPTALGDVLIWNQAVLHWGAQASQLTNEPRISLAFEFQSTDVKPFNLPLLEPLHFYDFSYRLKLIAKQVLQYQHMYTLEPELKHFSQQCLSLSKQ